MGILILITLAIYATVTCISGEELPLLQEGDLHIRNLTDSSVALIWKPRDRDRSNVTSPPAPLRLMVNVHWGSRSFYLTPTNDDPDCSIALRKCELVSLIHDTKYRVTVSIDDVKLSKVLGYATAEFTTDPIPDKGRFIRRVFLYVVLPGACGSILVLITMIIVCAKCCHCCCWHKKVELSRNLSNVEDVPVQTTQTLDEGELYDEPYSDASAVSQRDRSYLPLVSPHSTTTHHRFDFDPITGHTGSLPPSTSGRPLLQTRISLDEIVAMRYQGLQQNQNRLQHHNIDPSQLSRPSGRPSIDSDGYLHVMDKPKDTSHYANANSTQRQVFNML